MEIESSNQHSSQGTSQKRLNSVVEEMVDTIVAFDGRFAYEAPTDDGKCNLTFKTLKEMLYITVIACVTEFGDIRIDLLWSKSDFSMEQSSEVYVGPFEKGKISHQLGICLADWYGKAIRNELFLE